MKLILSISLIMFVASICNAENADVRVLLITGQNNHNWKQTTPLIAESLASTGRLEVEVTEKFETFPPERLGEFDVILCS